MLEAFSITHFSPRLGSPPPRGAYFLALRSSKTEALPSSLIPIKNNRQTLVKRSYGAMAQLDGNA